MLKAVIVDDEPKAIQSLSWELSHFKKEIEIVETFTIPEEAIAYLNNSEKTLDCLFLDIQMPTMDGFQFLDKIKNKDFSVVITTAYDEYAIKAIKHEAIDYLLKPIDSDDLSSTINKLKNINTKIVNYDKLEELFSKFNEDNNKQKITINTDGKLIFLSVDEIIFIEAEGNYCTIHLFESDAMVVTKKIKELAALLPEKMFFRIHNSYIINLYKVKEFIKTEGYVIMQSEHRIPVARQRKLDFLNRL
ncbi:LytR/AlgR family response regulator transcription factor [Flavobacteriaceae bacterium A100]|uniref:LytR/AlgR family response regulator transcription factor n=1 Tax=Oceanihabitans sediminis TaxID=1812012 RepID=UPI00093133EB